MLSRIIRSFIKKHLPFIYEWRQLMEINRRYRLSVSRKSIPVSDYPIVVAKQYEKRIGHILDWSHLETYTEKMQWEKLYDNNPLKGLLSDKIAVRKWVAEKIGDEFLIPLLGIWSKFDDIDFSLLPNRFVLKTNHGSGSNIIVEDKTNLNMTMAKKKINKWLSTDFGLLSFERHYSDITPRIIVEQFIESNGAGLQDYKFLCFEGKPMYCWVDCDRFSNHTRNVYNIDWKLQAWNQETYSNYREPLPKPINFEKMVEIASVLSAGFSHIRVDLYNINGRIYFGEMTFTNGGGYDRILPAKYDLELGKLWHIENIAMR